MHFHFLWPVQEVSFFGSEFLSQLFTNPDVPQRINQLNKTVNWLIIWLVYESNSGCNRLMLYNWQQTFLQLLPQPACPSNRFGRE
jgi:hypothetical protein